MADCPKCRGAMVRGFVYSPDSGSRMQWLDGEPGLWKMMVYGLKGKSIELTSRRCGACGFVEFFADPNPKPAKTLATIEEENEQLRRLVTRLQDRMATLETIVTDPADRITREIEDLRALPER